MRTDKILGFNITDNDFDPSDCTALLADARVSYVVGKIAEHFPDKFEWRSTSDTNDISLGLQHESVTLCHNTLNGGGLQFDFDYWVDVADTVIHLSSAAERRFPFRAKPMTTVTRWELNSKDKDFNGMYRVVEAILRRIETYFERGFKAMASEDDYAYCIQAGARIWRYKTAEEAWQNKLLDVRKHRYDGLVTFEEFKKQLDAGEEMHFYTVTAYLDGLIVNVYDEGW